MLLQVSDSIVAFLCFMFMFGYWVCQLGIFLMTIKLQFCWRSLGWRLVNITQVP